MFYFVVECHWTCTTPRKHKNDIIKSFLGELVYIVDKCPRLTNDEDLSVLCSDSSTGE